MESGMHRLGGTDPADASLDPTSSFDMSVPASGTSEFQKYLSERRHSLAQSKERLRVKYGVVAPFDAPDSPSSKDSGGSQGRNSPSRFSQSLSKARLSEGKPVVYQPGTVGSIEDLPQVPVPVPIARPLPQQTHYMPRFDYSSTGDDSNGSSVDEARAQKRREIAYVLEQQVRAEQLLQRTQQALNRQQQPQYSQQRSKPMSTQSDLAILAQKLDLLGTESVISDHGSFIRSVPSSRTESLIGDMNGGVMLDDIQDLDEYVLPGMKPIPKKVIPQQLSRQQQQQYQQPQPQQQQPPRQRKLSVSPQKQRVSAISTKTSSSKALTGKASALRQPSPVKNYITQQRSTSVGPASRAISAPRTQPQPSSQTTTVSQPQQLQQSTSAKYIPPARVTLTAADFGLETPLPPPEPTRLRRIGSLSNTQAAADIQYQPTVPVPVKTSQQSQPSSFGQEASTRQQQQQQQHQQQQGEGSAGSLMRTSLNLHQKLYDAVVARDNKLIKELVAAGADVSLHNAHDENRTVLHTAVCLGYDDTTQLLIESGCDVTAMTEDGSTPLHWAAFNGHLQCVQSLLLAGALVEAQDYEGGTALHKACYNGHTRCAQLLLEHGSSVNAIDAAEDTPLHKASYSGFADCVAVLIKRGAEINAKDKGGRTPLRKACYNGHVECAKVLVSAGADVNLSDNEQRSPLHRAAQGGHRECAELLLSHGAMTDARDMEGDAPLHKAAVCDNPECVTLLLDHGCDVDAVDFEGRTPLVKAISARQVVAVKILLERKANPNSVDSKGVSPLHQAVRYLDLLQLLIGCGADLDVCDLVGNTPLHFVAGVPDSVSVIQALVEAGANADMRNTNGDTPLMLACALGVVENVNALLDAGADISVRNRSNVSPLDAANQGGFSHVSALLNRVQRQRLSVEPASRAKGASERRWDPSPPHLPGRGTPPVSRSASAASGIKSPTRDQPHLPKASSYVELSRRGSTSGNGASPARTTVKSPPRKQISPSKMQRLMLERGVAPVGSSMRNASPSRNGRSHASPVRGAKNISPSRAYALPLTPELSQTQSDDMTDAPETINRAERPILPNCTDGLEMSDVQFEADFVLVLSWLKRLGMEKYINVFWTERVSHDMVRHLTDPFLKHLNVKMGPRRVMLADSAKLRSALPRSPVPPLQQTICVAIGMEMQSLDGSTFTTAPVVDLKDGKENAFVIRPGFNYAFSVVVLNDASIELPIQTCSKCLLLNFMCEQVILNPSLIPAASSGDDLSSTHSQISLSSPPQALSYAGHPVRLSISPHPTPKPNENIFIAPWQLPTADDVWALMQSDVPSGHLACVDGDGTLALEFSRSSPLPLLEVSQRLRFVFVSDSVYDRFMEVVPRAGPQLSDAIDTPLPQWAQSFADDRICVILSS